MTKQFPPYELYGMTSQARRALLSVILNYVEGFGRGKKGNVQQFYETSFGSLKESIYIFYLAARLEYISIQQYQQLFFQKEEIVRMLWKTIEGLRNSHL